MNLKQVVSEGLVRRVSQRHGVPHVDMIPAKIVKDVLDRPSGGVGEEPQPQGKEGRRSEGPHLASQKRQVGKLSTNKPRKEN